MKLGKSGQALIEFVLILPVLLLIIFAFIDFGRIIVCQNHLENVISEVAKINDRNEINQYLAKDESYKITYQEERDGNRVIILSTKLDLITPGLNNVLSNPYQVKVERRIIDE